MKVEGSASDIGGAVGAYGDLAKPSVAKDEFLKLLVAQLQYQDPMNPQDGAAFVAQLAQFAALEQSAEANTNLLAIKAEQTAASRIALTGLVGRTVKADASTIRLDGTGSPPLAVELDLAAKDVEVVITDETGKEVKTIDLGPHAPGTIQVNWDGTNASGTPLEGTYHVEVRAKDASDATVPARARLQGLVTGVDFSDGTIRIRIGNATIAPGGILSVEE